MNKNLAKPQRQLIKSLKLNEHEGQNILVKGWVRTIRKSKNLSFIVLNDGSNQRGLQLVVDSVLPNYDEVSKLTTGCCLAIKGKIVASQGSGQSLEMQATEVEIIGPVEESYPLQKKQTSLEFLREVAHLRPRTNTFGAVFRIRHELAMATHRFFSEQGFYYLHSPIITAFDGEGAGEMFHVTNFDLKKVPLTKEGKIDFTQDYFGKSANLCVTGQLEAEAFALALGAVYTFGPTFRAENSHTPRHLSEFWMIEPEVAFADLDDVAILGTNFIKALIQAALTHCPEEMEFLQKNYKPNLIETLKQVVAADFKKITYTEAIEILKNSGKKFEFKPDWGINLQTEHERYLTDEHFKLPVIVTDYPRKIKAFYMKVNPDQKTVRAMDILVPEVGEIIGGSQREDRLEMLIEGLKLFDLDPKEYDWYLDLRRHGGCPHAGFGLGFERAVRYITGMDNIRDVIAFPRTPGNLEF